MLLLKTTVLLVCALPFLISINAAETANVKAVREFVRDSFGYQNWCSKCRDHETHVNIDLYTKLCLKFDLKMIESLESLDVHLTRIQFIRIFIAEDFCLSATIPILGAPEQSKNSSYNPGPYITVLSDLPGWSDTQNYRPEIGKRRQGFCQLYWIIPVVVVLVILMVAIGAAFIWYGVKRMAESKQTMQEGNQVNAGSVFDLVHNL